MLRKFSVIVIVTFIRHTALRVYVAMWTLAGFLLLIMFAEPFVLKYMNRMEALGLAIMVTSLNAAMLWHAEIFRPYSPEDYVMSVSVIVLQVVLVLLPRGPPAVRIRLPFPPWLVLSTGSSTEVAGRGTGSHGLQRAGASQIWRISLVSNVIKLSFAPSNTTPALVRGPIQHFPLGNIMGHSSFSLLRKNLWLQFWPFWYPRCRSS